MLNFSNCYSSSSERINTDKKWVVFCIDGKTIHGGLSDRLRGLISTYQYCKVTGRSFVINWVYPFRLSDYLDLRENITNVKWGGYLSTNTKDVAYRFFNSYSFMNGDEEAYFRQLESKKTIIHVYSNVTINEEIFYELFDELFVPKASLKKTIDKCLSNIGGRYISVSFRFIGLLGDFKDTWTDGTVLTPEQKSDYIDHALKAIERLFSAHDNIAKVLVTADSNLFLDCAQRLPYVYVIPGQMVHMDTTFQQSYDVHQKTFLDFFLISKAEECYSYQYGYMFGGTKFARTAALAGGKKVKYIKE